MCDSSSPFSQSPVSSAVEVTRHRPWPDDTRLPMKTMLARSDMSASSAMPVWSVTYEKRSVRRLERKKIAEVSRKEDKFVHTCGKR